MTPVRVIVMLAGALACSSMAACGGSKVDVSCDEPQAYQSVVPSKRVEAPEGLDSTGDMRFQSMWTFLHVPCITLPTARGPNGLPVGIQLVGPYLGDDGLLGDAHWTAQQLMG